MWKRSFHPAHLCQIRAIAQQMLVALSGLESINVLHGDIKPDNIMFVDQINNPLKLKIFDFGLAVNPQELNIGTQMQINPFRAPEVILGLPLDVSVDMWSLAVVLATLEMFHFHTTVTMKQAEAWCSCWVYLRMTFSTMESSHMTFSPLSRNPVNPARGSTRHLNTAKPQGSREDSPALLVDNLTNPDCWSDPPTATGILYRVISCCGPSSKDLMSIWWMLGTWSWPTTCHMTFTHNRPSSKT
uniref:Protein kinase domain-containing protein n=1 Tax=Oryzias latipes TaxID=8090 RepID=A0A3P9LQF0_ORYLA